MPRADDIDVDLEPPVRPTSEHSDRPRVLLLADRPGWAYDTVARALVEQLSGEFDVRIAYVAERPDLHAWPFDLIHVFFWGETYHTRFGVPAAMVSKEVSSHRWANEDAYGRLSPLEFTRRYLADGATLTATSRRLQTLVSPYRDIAWAPNGVDEGRWVDLGSRRGPLRIGWAGNAADACKGVTEILQPAVGGDFEFEIAPGNLPADAMVAFYNRIDVFCVASTAEGTPLTLLEAMACGCFPVCVDVGVVDELVRHNDNGLVVSRSAAAFRAAFQWSAMNPTRVRQRGAENAHWVRATRSWRVTAGLWRNVFMRGLRASASHRGQADPALVAVP
jgi:hypothetical protein